ncbi:unnamed protein product [Cuscuta epithymum]|uniref:Uncharacterized protein n=1 Tax=Cuscuta epithymum TaxID=186058 RepID=A0AAV0ETN7_9ASTE|nr:unnamed protein product [Cuscuta epithymum]CAH9126471.1 unnamed protein product [Cuscuta epithymum]CAH9138321.1 unnamed protein product [Cuscuta epithymum]
MRTLCPNLDREDALETVLEVPIPEEMFPCHKTTANKPWQTMKSWMMKPHSDKSTPSSVFGGRSAEIQLLLSVAGAPLVPAPIPSNHSCANKINDHPIESSMAKYIIKQYIAAAGGESAMNSVESMYAMGKVKMAASEFTSGGVGGGEGLQGEGKAVMMKMKSMKSGGGEVGGFVLWQRRPGLWSLELVVSGCKISAGCDGKLAWRQTPWQNSHASRGPPRPLRRSLQGLDPRSTANLFSNAICTGEKPVNGEDCFVLKLEAEAKSLKARSSGNVEIIKHTMWGYFSQRTGLLVQLEDSHLLKIKSPNNDNVYWETNMESLIQDYRPVNGVNIAHAGRTSVSLFRFGENEEENTRTRMEELWNIEEVDFNIKGLSLDCFLPPSDLMKEDDHLEDHSLKKEVGNWIGMKLRSNTNGSNKVSSGKGVKIAAIDEYYVEKNGDYEQQYS